MRRLLAALIASTALSGGPALAQQTHLDDALTALSAAVDEAGFSGSVVVLRHGETVFAEARGMADQAEGRPNTLDTRFNTASTGKFITALAYLRAAHDAGHSDPLSLHPGDVLNRSSDLFAPDLTVGDLMAHRTTIESFYEAENAEARGLEAQNNADIFDLLLDAQDGPVTVRRDGLAYNNGNAIVTGEITARLTGLSYEDAVRTLVFDPAGADSARFTRLDQADALDLALPYVEADFDYETMMRRGAENAGPLPSDYPRLEVTPLTNSISMAAGGLYISAPDLAAIGAAALDGRVLTREELTTLCTSILPIPGRILGYGCGGVELAPDLHRWGHGGGAPGINAQLAIYPELGLVVAIAANHNQRATPVLDAFEAALTDSLEETTRPGGFILRQ